MNRQGVRAFVAAPWTHSAACRNRPTAWWYSDTPAHQRKALAVCGVCPVKDECLKAAYEQNEDGIWGGTLAIDRGRKRWETGNHAGTAILETLVCQQCKTVFKKEVGTPGRQRLYCTRSCGKQASRLRRRDDTSTLFDRLRNEVEANL